MSLDGGVIVTQWVKFSKSRTIPKSTESLLSITTAASKGSIRTARGEVMFFFSSRRRHTRWNCDWSSDVCSSDLGDAALRRRPIDEERAAADAGGLWLEEVEHELRRDRRIDCAAAAAQHVAARFGGHGIGRRSEERRVGKEGRAGRATSR